MPKTLIKYKHNYIDVSQGRKRIANYGGYNGEKWTWFYNSIKYMIKSQEKNKEARKFKSTLDQPILSYNNFILSEYVGSHIINFLKFNNINAQTTFLVKEELESKKIRFWVACEILESQESFNPNENYWIFKPIANLDNFNFADKNLNENRSRLFDNIPFSKMVKWILKEQKYLDAELFVNYFYDLFIVDALILNWDRNPTNWGLIQTEVIKNNQMSIKYSLAPLIDQGSTLFAKNDSKGFEEIKNLSNIEDIDKVIKNTKSFFLDDNKQKIIYLDYFQNTNDEKLFERIKIFFQTINIKQLIIDIKTLNLPNKYKQTYALLIKRSYELIYKSLENNLNYQNYLNKYKN